MLPNHWATRKGNLAESLWGFFGTQFWQTTDRSFQHFDKDDLKHQIRDIFKHYFCVWQTTTKSFFLSFWNDKDEFLFVNENDLLKGRCIWTPDVSFLVDPGANESMFCQTEMLY